MTMTYTFDVFSSLDGFGSYDTNTGNWGGYWGKQGPELLERRLKSVHLIRAQAETEVLPLLRSTHADSSSTA